MKIRGAVVASALALVLTASAYAGSGSGMRPIQGRPIELGTMSGVAYYTVEDSGYRVVAVLSQGEDNSPVRVEAVLADGQSVTLSTPNEVNTAPTTIQISRQDDKVFVQQAVYWN
ncbi:MAG: hypothetical protein U1E45_23645 [Geminicoccaceae bacterium]